MWKVQSVLLLCKTVDYIHPRWKVIKLLSNVLVKNLDNFEEKLDKPVFHNIIRYIIKLRNHNTLY